ncbi:MAG: BamA/TamA family outer membrane protein, partial [Thermodesulfobacteriota bacterium]
SPDDRFILFTSDRTGVYNLFAYSVAEEKVYQVTHVLGGAFQADILRDEKGIVFSSYDSRGFKIVTMDYNPDAWEETAGPIIKPYWQSKKTDTSKETQPIHITEPETYSPISTIAPGFWLPSISVDHEGAVIGIFTAGQDVLAYNTYFIDVGYGVESSKPYLDISYYYDRSYPTISMNGYIRPVLYSNFFDKGDYYERQKGVVLTASVPINYLESKYRFIIGYHLKQQEHLTKLTDGKFDGIEVFEGRRDYTFLGIEFSNALRYPYSISREEGRNISFYYRHYSKTLGSDIDSTEYIGSYQEHINLSFIGESQKHSVVYLNLKGAISEDNQISQQAFQLGGSSILETEFPLRGYPSRFAPGKYIATATLEYRSPIRYLFKGRNTKPFFLDRLYGALFMDAGNVWDNNRDFEWGDLKIGLGGELRLDMILGYKLYITPTIGLAHGLDKEGETNVYFTIHTEI